MSKKLAATALCAVLSGAAGAFAQEQYEVGGPLAGEKLPLYKTQHGEPAGYPGCIPELAQKAVQERAEAIKAGKEKEPYAADAVPYSPQGMQPEVELYPGAVEHFRDNFFKYLSVRSLFDRQSQLKNFVAPNLPGAGKEQVEEYAEPVYWVGRFDAIRFTGRKNKPVPVVRCKIGAPVFKLDLGTLDRGLYALRVIAAVETEKLRPFREPLFLRCRVNSGLNGEVNDYLKRVNYNDEFYGITAFYFHAPAQRSYSAELTVAEGSKVELLVHNITLDNALTGCEWKPLKTARTLTNVTEAESSSAKDPAGKRTPDVTDERTARKYPIGNRTPDTAEERLARDAAIWNYSLPPLNVHADHWTYGFGSKGWGSCSYGAAGQSEISVTRGADFYRSQVCAVNEKAAGTVRCSLGAQHGVNNMTASDDSLSHFWRAEGSGTTFALTGGAVTPESFGKENVLRLWEYGVGDSVRQPTHVSLRRIGEGLYELEANVACAVGLPVATFQMSLDGKAFLPAKGEKQGKLLALRVTEQDLASRGMVWIRTEGGAR